MSGQTAVATAAAVATFVLTGGNLAATQVAWTIAPAVGGLCLPDGNTAPALAGEPSADEEKHRVIA